MNLTDKRMAVSASAQGSITARCRAVELARSTYYHRPKGESGENLRLMEVMDRLYMDNCHLGVIGMRDHLRLEGHWYNEKRIRRLMHLMGLEAVGPRPNTSAPAPGHTVYPYLLRGVRADGPDHIWSTDITYIPMGKGFMYLVAVMDWHSRYVLSWRISNTLSTQFCIDALNDALATGRRPRIFNTDQGSQFTSNEFTGLLRLHDIAISMDGKGRATDNAFIERLWRSVKHECIYLNSPTDGRQLRSLLAPYFDRFNNRRPRQSLDGLTPAHAYFGLPDNRSNLNHRLLITNPL
jgi:putative transposase